MGSPQADGKTGVLDPKVVEALHHASQLLEEPISVARAPRDVRGRSEGGPLHTVTVQLPHHGVARIKLQSA